MLLSSVNHVNHLFLWAIYTMANCECHNHPKGWSMLKTRCWALLLWNAEDDSMQIHTLSYCLSIICHAKKVKWMVSWWESSVIDMGINGVTVQKAYGTLPEKDPMGSPFILMENMGLKNVTLLMDGYLWFLWPIQSTRCHLFFSQVHWIHLPWSWWDFESSVAQRSCHWNSIYIGDSLW